MRYAAICLLIYSAGAVGLTRANSDALGEEIPWTDRPVRINREQQKFERLPAAEPDSARTSELALPIAKTVRVLDAANFISGGRAYRIEGLKGLQPNQICRDELNRKWACGARSRATLRSMLVKRRTTRCFVEGQSVDPVNLRCMHGGMPLPAFLIARGLAEPAKPKPVR